MAETPDRLLRLLSLLQSRRTWAGTELAQRLDVTTRTVRRDIERLRKLGYPVHASQGAAGYQLGAGANLPPLLLDNDEAVAVVVGLRTAASGSVVGIEETSLRALSKIEQILPSRLRHRVETLHSAMVRVGARSATVDPDTLMAVADACRRHERLRFDYTSPHRGDSLRIVEPHSLVSFTRRWYLVAWDVGREQWRTFRVDRLRPRIPTGPRFRPRPPPDGDVAAFVARQLTSGPWPMHAIVTLHEPADTVAERIWPGMGTVEAIDERSCRLHVGADTTSALVWMITSLDVNFTVESGSAEFVDAVHALADRCARAIGTT